MHKSIDPAILYFGTPVALLVTENEDGTLNVAPNSSIFWLGWSCMIGIDASSKTTENILRTNTCVVNLPSYDLAPEINTLSLLTGSSKVPLHKKLLGYQYAKNKLERTRLSFIESNEKSSMRIAQCPVQLEAVMVACHPFGLQDKKMGVPVVVFELTVSTVYANENILLDAEKDKIDPLKWNPLIMSFRRFFGLSGEVARSTLYSGSEDLYAPWKMGGMLGSITRFALKRSVRQFEIKKTSR